MKLAAMVTDLGDLAIVGSAGLFVAVWCATRLRPVIGLATLLCLTLLAIFVAVLKAVAASGSPEPWLARQWMLTRGAPSGHAAMATFVFGFSAWLFVRTGSTLANRLGALGCLGVVAAVAVTRVTLHHHTMADVAAGLAVASVPLGLMVATVRGPANSFQAPAIELMVGLTVASLAPLLFGVRLSGATVI